MTKIKLYKGDITKLRVDVIVNAANNTLLGGGGVDGAIHRSAGVKLLNECRKLQGCATGDAKITKGYNLSAAYVIHTVGPVYTDGKNNEPKLLTSCYLSSLELAVQNKLKTIAFPNISTGVYGYPKSEAAEIAIQTVKKFIVKNELLEQITFCVFDDKNFEIYKKLLK